MARSKNNGSLRDRLQIVPGQHRPHTIRNGAIFVASLRAERRTASRVNVVRASFAHPAIRTAVLIRWQAARLWLRGLKVQPR